MSSLGDKLEYRILDRMEKVREEKNESLKKNLSVRNGWNGCFSSENCLREMK